MTQESTDLRTLKLGRVVHGRDWIFVAKQNLAPPKTLANIPGPDFVCVRMSSCRHCEARLPQEYWMGLLGEEVQIEQ